MTSAPIDSNRAAWDMLVPIHEKSEFYDLTAFLEGQSSLCPLEQSLVGPCCGKDLLHLQCHFGLDSLSWARLGANVTGVDFSPTAIRTAKRLAEASGQAVSFLCNDVQKLQFESQFDVAVTTYGVLCWIESLQAWAEGIYRSLRPGGCLVVVEFHPILEALYPGKMTGRGSYFGGEGPSVVHTTGSYADRSARIEYQEYRWQHPISEVVSSLLKAGFTIYGFEEYPYCAYGLFDELERTMPGVWVPKEPAVWPYMFSVKAGRPR